MPRSKKPTSGAGVERRRSTAASSPWTNRVSSRSRSAAESPASRPRGPLGAAAAGTFSGPTSSSRNGGRKRRSPQSTAATTLVPASCRIRRDSARSPRSGAIHSVPERESRPPSRRRSSASPTSDHGPHAIAWPGSPSARRCRASWSRKALAAAWFACPALPRTPTALEKRTKRSRSRASVARCRRHAPRTLGASTFSKRGQSRFVSAPSDRTPTLWTTPASGCSSASTRASIASTASPSATSAISTRTSAPRSRNASTAARARAPGSRRPFSTIVPAPASASQLATSSPMPPSPPVTR